jgi:starch-binding outer membrane protein, SusD/RagB family
MKKSIFNSRLFCAVLLSAASWSACTDLVSEGTDSTIIQTATGDFKKVDVKAFLAASYTDLGVFADQGNVYSLNSHAADEMIPPTRGTDWGDNGVWRSLDTHTWDASHEQVRNTWNDMNQRAYRCNVILASDPDAGQKAQTHFMRAFYTFQVMDLFGQVPVRQYNEGPDVNPKVLTRTDAFNYIVGDLNEALKGLPSGKPAAQNRTATKAAANYMLAYLYLNKHIYTGAAAASNEDMNQVLTYTQAIKDEGYSLTDDYFGLFTTKAANENIFTTGEGNINSRFYMTTHYDSHVASNGDGGWNGFTTLSEFYAKFQPGDQRLGSFKPDPKKEFSWLPTGFVRGLQYAPKRDTDDRKIILKDANGGFVITPLIEQRSKTYLIFTDDVTLAGTGTQKGIRVIKYHPADRGDYVLMRYGAVLLMRAEALLRSGKVADAQILVDELRAKRKTTKLSGTLDNDKMFDEWARETYWEGHSRNEEIRFGKWLSAKGVVNRGAHTVLYPIPALAVSSNPNIRQNAGY